MPAARADRPLAGCPAADRPLADCPLAGRAAGMAAPVRPVAGPLLAVLRPARFGSAPVRARAAAAGVPVAERKRGSEVVVIGAVPG